jgi:hypothetical protein
MRLDLDPNGRQVLGEADVPAGTAAVSHLLVHVPAEHRGRVHTVAIRQLYAGREVGRITWRLVPGH